MRKIYLLVLLIVPMSLWAQIPNTWTQITNFGGGERERMVSFSIDGYGYVACGQDTANQVHNDLWQYNAPFNTWTQKASLPGSARRNACGFAIGSEGFVGCGIDGDEAPTSNILKDFWKYTPATNSWVQVADYPGGFGFGVYFATSFSNGTKGYVLGGKVGSNSYLDQFWEYKPSADQWVQRASFPGGVRFQLTGLGVAGKIYAGLGADHDMFNKDWYEFDPGTNTWTQKGDFDGYVRAACVSFVINDRAFVCLGTDGGYTDDLWEYNPYVDYWTSRDDFPPSGRKWSSAFVINGEGYVGSGKSASGIKRSWYKYTPVIPTGIDGQENQVVMTVYPNPVVAGSKVTFSSPEEQKMLEIFDLNGRMLKALDVWGMKEITINENYPPGQYLLVLKNENSDVLDTRKIVVL